MNNINSIGYVYNNGDKRQNPNVAPQEAPKKEAVVEETYKELKKSEDLNVFGNWFDSPKGSIADDDDYLSDVISILKKNSNK